MSSVLGEAGRAVLKVVLAGLVALAISVTAAPDLASAGGVLELGLIGLAVAVLSTLTPFVPRLSVASYLPEPYGRLADAFIHAGVGAFLTSIIGIASVPDLSTWHSLVVAALVGALNAGFHGISDAFTAGKKPFTQFGVRKT